jgi:abhydrolase domain-containing protein 6
MPRAGEGEVVLLLHGFGASKEVWMRMVREMPAGYRYVIPDLPGFGNSSYLPDADYDVASQVPRLHAFVQQLGLTRFHVLGNSMGGNLATLYAATHPQQVASLGLFAPSGVTQPNPSPYTRAYLERGEPKLIAASREDYRQIFKDAFVDPPYAPDFLLNSLADAQVARRGEYLRMYQQFWGRRTPLEPLLPVLAMPALLLWGDQDKILDVSAAQVFKQGLPHVEAVIWPNVGHAPMLEKAADSARLYAGFIGRYPVR